MKHKIKNIIFDYNLVNIFSILCVICRVFKVKENKIVFSNFNGKGYGDSPKYIAEALIKKKDNCDMIWILEKNVSSENIPSNIRIVKKYSLRYFYELTTAKFWVANNRFPTFIRKRKQQIYIQTWHGGLALKKIEYDASDKLSKYYSRVIENDNLKIDYLLSNSIFCTNMYRNAFKYNGKILEIGTPRNDILVNKDMELKSKVVKKCNIDYNSKILLYAPTFRKSYVKNPYDIDFVKLKKILEKNGEKWEILVRLHPNVKCIKEKMKNLKSCIDVTNYDDIQELILACDMLITDYSSTMFEAMIANKSVFLYANDIENYVEERGFYFNFNELPFALAQSNEQLFNIINKFDFSDIESDYKNFKDKVGLKEEGKACETIIKIIEENMRK